MKSILPQNNRHHRAALKPRSSKRAAGPGATRLTAAAPRRRFQCGRFLLVMALIHPTSGVLSATEPQIPVSVVSNLMRDVPTDMHIIDWRKTALLYYQTMFNPNPGFSAPGFPTVYVAPNSSFFSFQPSLGAPATGLDQSDGFAMLAAEIGAEMVGMNMTGPNSYQGVDWLHGCEFWFAPVNPHVGGGNPGIWQDHPGWQGGEIGHVIYSYANLTLGLMLSARHPGDTVLLNDNLAEYGVLLQMAHTMGCPDNPVRLDRGYNTNTGTLTGNFNNYGNASSLGWMLYLGYLTTGNPDYLQCAESALEWQLDNPGRYEWSYVPGPLAVARINAEQGGNLDLRAMMDNFFGDASRFADSSEVYWFVQAANFGSYDADGLDGANGYEFPDGCYGNVGFLAPVARYDQRYADVIGKYFLNAANSDRLLLGIDLDWDHQDHKDWRDSIPNGAGYTFSYEGLSYYPHFPDAAHDWVPYGSGDYLFYAYANKPAAVYWSDKAGTTVPADGIHFSQTAQNIAPYQGDFIGFLGGVFNATNVQAIPAWDLLQCDALHAPAYPTYLVRNPYTNATAVVLNTGTSAVDLYDTVSGVFVAKNVSGNQTINLGPLQTMVLVYAPAGGTVTYNGSRMLINGVIVDYRSMGNGLRGEYCNNVNGANPTVVQIDPQVNFNWGGASPAPGIGGAGFSVRWSGSIVPQTTEEYLIGTTSDDGVRVWINGNLVINNWTDHPPSTDSGAVALTANQPAQIQVEYYQRGGGSQMQLFWASPSIPWQLIPQSRMSPSAGNGLQAQYYGDQNLGVPAMTRTDSTLNFNWGSGAPDRSVNSAAYSVRWSGYVTAPTTATYTFSTYTAGGVRLLLNGAPVINDWNASAQQKHSFQVQLLANQQVAIEINYFNAPGAGSAQLTWSSTEEPQEEVVPANYFSTIGVPWGSWTDANIGSPGVSGSAAVTSYADGACTVSGSGSDIWNTSDQFNFFSTSVNGDETLMTEVTGMTNTDPWAKAGVMFRDSNAPGSIVVGLYATEANGVNLEWRSATGGGCSFAQVPGVAAPSAAQPVWLKLVRSGRSYTGFYSRNGQDWFVAGSASVTFTNSQYLAGLAVTAHNNSLLNTASFANTSLSPTLEGTAASDVATLGSFTWSGGAAGSWGASDSMSFDFGPQATVLAAWTDADIGAPGQAGTASYNSSTGAWTVAAGGADIWNNTDQFNYVSESATGDTTLIAEVTGITNTDPWAKAGVMIRDSSAANSMFVDMMATESNGVSLQWRNATGGSCGYLPISAPTPSPSSPVWVKLVKSGATYTGYFSLDGSVWTIVGATNVALTNSTYLGGLAVTAHNNSLLNTATFAGFSLLPTGWTSIDIGAPGNVGSALYNSVLGTWAVSGSGLDMWGQSDQFHFASQSTTGDTTVVAEVTDITDTHPWNKTAVMIRDSAAANSAFVDVITGGSDAVALEWRDVAGNSCTTLPAYVNISEVATPSPSNPMWLKLVKSGTTYTGYYWMYGLSDWTLIGSTTVTFTNSVYLCGLGVDSHTNSGLCMTTFGGFWLVHP